MIKSKQQGTVLVYALMVVSIVLTASFLLLSRVSLDFVSGTRIQAQSEEVRQKIFGCLDEVIIQLSVNPEYAPAEVEMGAYSCTLAVSGLIPQDRLIELELTQDSTTRRLQVTMDVEAMTISELREE